MSKDDYMTKSIPSKIDKAAVIGAGAWGTALASLLAGQELEVRLWAYEPFVAEAINNKNENTEFLAGETLPQNLRASSDLEWVCGGMKLIVLVMPSHVFREVLGQAAAHLHEDAVLVSCSKGIELDTGFTMCDVAQDVLPKTFHRRLACLSGPSFAREVARGVPTVVTAAARDPQVALMVQHVFSAQVFRVYTSPDLVGVEMGGAVKNPLAIAAGMVAGLELGHNTLAALITRGLAEMTRLSQAQGGQMATLAGLAGLGDLVLTCTSSQSRNYTVGFRLGQGESIQDIAASMNTVAEGVRNTKTVLALAKRAQVDMPIIQAVYDVIYENKPPMLALQELMGRDLKPELY